MGDNGFDAVLVGGAVVSIYSEGAYESGDLDFIIQNLSKEKLPEVMKEIGFIKKGKNYVHPDCDHLFVEFPSGPLGMPENVLIKLFSLVRHISLMLLQLRGGVMEKMPRMYLKSFKNKLKKNSCSHL